MSEQREDKEDSGEHTELEESQDEWSSEDLSMDAVVDGGPLPAPGCLGQLFTWIRKLFGG